MATGSSEGSSPGKTDAGLSALEDWRAEAAKRRKNDHIEHDSVEVERRLE